MWAFSLIFILSVCPSAHGGGKRIVVDAAGSGQFTSIQKALDSIHPENLDPVIVFIKRGTYREKLYITKSFVSLVGEDRDSTRIVFAELRSQWTQSRDNRPDGSEDEQDWGSAVMNIGGGATDVTIANLTVHNNYGGIHGTRAHQFTIRGFDATRIALLHCNVISDGGDAVALWNRKNGLYYHSNCYFEGWVDFVCPRGWCYITDSEFYGHNMSASIWHDGSANEDQKFVMRNSRFDGRPGFPLGRHHRDAQFYLIDCNFSDNMADRSLYAPNSPNLVPWRWGDRQYYYNCKRAGGDFEWFSDNLQKAEGKPHPDDITAVWTFNGTWDPESTLPSVLPFAAIPQPRNEAYEVNRTTVLRWIPAYNEDTQIIRFGQSNYPPVVASTRVREFHPDLLKPSTRYIWRIDTIVGKDTLKGITWTFTTGS